MIHILSIYSYIITQALDRLEISHKWNHRFIYQESNLTLVNCLLFSVANIQEFHMN